MSFQDFLFGLPFHVSRCYPFSYQPEDTFSFFKREERDKEINLLIGDTLVKVLLTASKDDYSELASISCRVLEINGEPVFKEESDQKVQTLFLREAPSLQQQKNLLLDTLEKFGINGNPIMVSDDYVRGHLRVLKLRIRLAGGGR